MKHLRKVVSNVTSSNVHFQCCHSYQFIPMIEEAWKDIKYSRFCQDDFLHRNQAINDYHSTVLQRHGMEFIPKLTCKFSGLNCCPYKSIADKNIDSY